MKEWFIKANSFAAPFVSDDSTEFVEAKTAELALLKFIKEYQHHAGLYAAVVYESAEAYHKNKKPVAKWLCNYEIEKMRLTKNLGGYSFRGNSPGGFEIDGRSYVVENPKDGALVEI